MKKTDKKYFDLWTNFTTDERLKKRSLQKE